jgi:hypothetical protein
MIPRFTFWRDFKRHWLRRTDTSTFTDTSKAPFTNVHQQCYDWLAYLLGLLSISSLCLWVGSVLILFLAE